MKIFHVVITYLVAALFVILGAGNYFFHFIPDPPPPPEPAASWIGAMYTTKYLLVVKIFELIGGLLLAFNKRPLGWAILLPICVNIAMYEVFMVKSPGMGIVLLIINLYFVFVVYKEKFKAIWS